jgi:hypothetical protein
MSSRDDSTDGVPAGAGPQPPSWDTPPQPPAWDRPVAGGAVGWDPPPAHGAPTGAPPWQAPAQTEPKAVVALVLAGASYVVIPLLGAVAALVLARMSKRDIEASGGRLTGAGLLTAARVLAWVNLALCLLAVVLVVAAVILLASVGFS